jgi:hypothetical protein
VLEISDTIVGIDALISFDGVIGSPDRWSPSTRNPGRWPTRNGKYGALVVGRVT